MCMPACNRMHAAPRARLGTPATGRHPPPPAPARRQFPYSYDEDSGWTTTGPNAWTSGFYPGVLWQLYNLTGKPEWRAAAERWTAKIADQQRDWALQHDFGAGGGGRRWG